MREFAGCPKAGMMRGPCYHHAPRHVFVLAASICHYWAVYLLLTI